MAVLSRVARRRHTSATFRFYAPLTARLLKDPPPQKRAKRPLSGHRKAQGPLFQGGWERSKQPGGFLRVLTVVQLLFVALCPPLPPAPPAPRSPLEVLRALPRSGITRRTLAVRGSRTKALGLESNE